MKLRHVLGISGGKDSTALAIYLRLNYPELDIEYYFCDTDKELPETYDYIHNLEIFLGKNVTILPPRRSEIPQFDFFIKKYGGYLPSVRQRWCTVEMKLRPFERYVANDNVVSYVGIRGDEERSAYISTQENIQSILPFRKNIWSDDVTLKVLSNHKIDEIAEIFKTMNSVVNNNEFYTILTRNVSAEFDVDRKANTLLDIDSILYNHIVFNYIKTTNYPLSRVDHFPLIDNNEILTLADIKKVLLDSGVGLPPYYNEIEFEVDGNKGYYNRSRSGCFFCFYQQKIEWIWLYEQHPDLFEQAMEYEKEGYTWMQEESLSELIKPARIKEIKKKQIERLKKEELKGSNYLIDSLDLEDAACMICSL